MPAARQVIGWIAAFLLAWVVPARGWHGPGHVKATTAAIAAMEKKLPQFVTDFADTVAHGSVEPDVFRLREHPQLRSTEAPDHYFDLEHVAGWKLPATRYEFLAMCAAKGRKPSDVGLAPYAIVEWTQRLTIAFAEHRAWPDDENVQAACLIYAGLLAHYAQDLCQPLHVTIHYDGRVGKDGTSPGTGIHQKVDALLQKTRVTPAKVAKALKPARLKDLLPAVLDEARRSNALVDRVYELEKHLPAAPEAGKLPAAVEALAVERLRRCAEFTASLYLTAWANSATLKLPAWLGRERAECPLRRTRTSGPSTAGPSPPPVTPPAED